MFLQEIEEFVEELRDIIVRLLYQKYSFLSEQKKTIFSWLKKIIDEKTFESGYLTISSSILIWSSDRGIYKC